MGRRSSHNQSTIVDRLRAVSEGSREMVGVSIAIEDAGVVITGREDPDDQWEAVHLDLWATEWLATQLGIAIRQLKEKRN